jgi:hypothetical protein
MSVENSDYLRSWAKFLHPKVLRGNLISVSLYLVAWETFEHGVMDYLEGFFCHGFDEKGLLLDDSYKKEVLSRDKSPFRASLMWFKESGAIDDSDFEIADRARQHRNDIAHKLPEFISTKGREVDVALLGDMCRLMDKIDVWWIRNIEIPTNSDFDGQDVDSIPDSEIQSGRMMFLGMIFRIATEEDSEAIKYYEEFTKMAEKLDSRR